MATLRRGIAALLACLLLLTPVLALGSSTSSVPTIQRVAMVISPDMPLHPLRILDRDAVSLLGLVYESLVELDDNRKPAPKLATWSTDDGKIWTFTIKQNVIFHDGRELTAYDVAATMDYIKALAENDSLAANEKGLYYLLPTYCSRWEATDTYTLQVHTKDPSYGLLYAMTFPVLQAQSISLDNPPGTGPYRVDYYVPGAELSLVGNSNWRERPPHVSEVLGKWYASDDDALRAFESEQVDIVMTRSPASVRYRGTLSSRINSYEYATRQIEVLLFDLASNKIKDSLMREAICCAIDKSRLIQNVYQNIVTDTRSLLRPGSWLYNDPFDRSSTEEKKRFAYNPERSKQLLGELGWTLIDEEKGFRYKKNNETGAKTNLTIRIGYYNEAGNTLRRDAAREIANMLTNVGFDVSVNKFDTIADAQKKLSVQDYDIFLCAYNFDVVPDPTFLLATGDTNYTRYSSKEMNELLKRLHTAYDSQDYYDVWSEIQMKMWLDMPMFPLYYRNGVVLSRYAYSSIRDIREYELLNSLERYQ